MLMFQLVSHTVDSTAIWTPRLDKISESSGRCLRFNRFSECYSPVTWFVSSLLVLAVIGLSSLPSWASVNWIDGDGSAASLPLQPSQAGSMVNQDRQQVLVRAASTEDWIEMKPKNAGASFKMITKPRYLERVFKPVDDQPSIKMRSFLSTFQNGDGLMVFMYTDLPEEPIGKAIVDTLEGIALGSVSNLNGKITHHEKTRYKDYPGLSYEFRFAKDEQLHGGVGRAFLVGKRQYVISIMMKEANFDQATALAFFESFRITTEEEVETDQADSSSGK